MIAILPQVRESILSWAFPVSQMSISSATEYRDNPRSFFIRYVLWNFDETTSWSALIGQSVHKALEVYYDVTRVNPRICTRIEEKDGENVEVEVDPVTFSVEAGIAHFEHETAKKKIQALAKNAEFMDLLKAEEDPVIASKVSSILAKSLAWKKANEFTESYQDFEYLENWISIKDISYSKFFAPDVCETLIKWWRVKDPDGAKAQIESTFRRYLSFIADKEDLFVYGTPIYTEMKDMTRIIDPLDPEEQPIPIPVKGVTDRIDIDGEDVTIVDYKTTDIFTPPWVINWMYAYAAWMYFFIALSKTGKRPKQMKFIEIAKGEKKPCLPSDPTKNLLQADLRQLCEENGIVWEKYDKNDDLFRRLTDAGILVTPDPVNIVTIDYEKDSWVVPAFTEFLKETINQIGTDQHFMPNPKAKYNANEAFADYVADFDLMGQWLDPIQYRIDVAKKAREVTNEETGEIEIPDFSDLE